jgi:hypothetical protein
MKYIKSFNSFVSESVKNNVVDEILTSLSDDIQYLIGKYEESFKEKFERDPSNYDREMFRLNAIWDMVKAIEIYTSPTDSLVTVSSTISNKGNLEISAQIQRGGEVYDFNTEVIYAGGYNIQKLHFRYITKTNLPKTGSDTVTKEYADKIKKLSKLEKLNNEIQVFQNRIKANQDLIAANSALSDSEILELIKKNDNNIDVTWKDIVNRGAEKNYKDQADFEQKLAEYIKSKIEFWKIQNINWKAENVKNSRIQMEILKKKISKYANI